MLRPLLRGSTQLIRIGLSATGRPLLPALRLPSLASVVCPKMIGGASTEEFLRTSANEEMLGGDENDPILAGIDDFLVDQQGVPDVGVDHQGVTITGYEEQERGFFDEDDDDDDEVLDGVPSGDDGDDDDLRSPFTLGADMRRSTHGDAHARGVAAGVPASRWDSHVVVSLVLARDPPPSRVATAVSLA